MCIIIRSPTSSLGKLSYHKLWWWYVFEINLIQSSPVRSCVFYCLSIARPARTMSSACLCIGVQFLSVGCRRQVELVFWFSLSSSSPITTSLWILSETVHVLTPIVHHIAVLSRGHRQGHDRQLNESPSDRSLGVTVLSSTIFNAFLSSTQHVTILASIWTWPCTQFGV